MVFDSFKFFGLAVVVFSRVPSGLENGLESGFGSNRWLFGGC